MYTYSKPSVGCGFTGCGLIGQSQMALFPQHTFYHQSFTQHNLINMFVEYWLKMSSHTATVFPSNYISVILPISQIELKSKPPRLLLRGQMWKRAPKFGAQRKAKRYQITDGGKKPETTVFICIAHLGMRTVQRGRLSITRVYPACNLKTIF